MKKTAISKWSLVASIIEMAVFFYVKAPDNGPLIVKFPAALKKQNSAFCYAFGDLV